MAQLRQQYGEFVAHGAEVLVIAPHSLPAVKRHWEKHQLPMPGLADPKHSVANQYGQEVSLLKLGRMPSLLIVDRAGRIRFTHYAESMRDYPENGELFAALDAIEHEI